MTSDVRVTMCDAGGTKIDELSLTSMDDAFNSCLKVLGNPTLNDCTVRIDFLKVRGSGNMTEGVDVDRRGLENTTIFLHLIVFNTRCEH